MQVARIPCPSRSAYFARHNNPEPPTEEQVTRSAVEAARARRNASGFAQSSPLAAITIDNEKSIQSDVEAFAYQAAAKTIIRLNCGNPIR